MSTPGVRTTTSDTAMNGRSCTAAIVASGLDRPGSPATSPGASPAGAADLSRFFHHSPYGSFWWAGRILRALVSGGPGRERGRVAMHGKSRWLSTVVVVLLVAAVPAVALGQGGG